MDRFPKAPSAHDSMGTYSISHGYAIDKFLSNTFQNQRFGSIRNLP
jgi:hypothetical protein